MNVKFGDVVREVKVNIDRTNNPYERYVAGEHMDTDTIKISRWGSFAEPPEPGPAFTRLFEPGQVLFGSRRTYLRKIAVPDFEGVCANTTFVLETKDEDILTQQILPFIMYTDSFINYSIINSKGSTNPYILFSDIAKFEFNLPNIHKQHELADCLWELNSLREAYVAQLAGIDALVKSQFLELFGNMTVNDKGWNIKPFQDFAKIDATMTTEYEKYADYPHIGIDSIESGTGELKGYRTVKQDSVKSGKYFFTPNHIIYSKIRPSLNKVALPSFEGLCSADAYPILSNCCNCNRLFLAYVLRSELFLTFILPFSYRTSFPKVNCEQISRFTMPLPPLDLQSRFADFVIQADKSKFVSSNPF